ncbi:MAG: thioredoxin family protein [Victivallales bacterium]|nr:thioredoxin family protein [Victivallales bacterium]
MKQLIFALLLPLIASAAPLVEFRPRLETDSEPSIVLDFTVVPEGHVYADSLELELPSGFRALAPQGTQPTMLPDEERAAFTGHCTLRYPIQGTAPLPSPLSVTLRWQGCQDGLCHLPASNSFALAADASTSTASPAQTSTAANAADSLSMLDGFVTLSSNAGYLSPKEFLAWAERATSGQATQTNDNPVSRTLRHYGPLAAGMLILLLGILLNLTPCVLPMIPITLLVIGAGARKTSTASGLLRGLLYGLGMALSYGLLGVFAVRTGGRFAALNSSPWFNLAVCAIFLLLALAMFDCFHIDLSRWRGTAQAGSLTGIFLLGALSAILAGACVAPVLIWTLLLSSSAYAQGFRSALALPFLLGLGMALPWPILGAGIGRVPRPGAWMIKIRAMFGALILLFAAWYAWTAWRQFAPPQEIVKEGWHTTMEEAIADSRANRTPLFLEFTGLACKSCAAMEATTFRDKSVQKMMQPWSKVALRADNPQDAIATELATHFHITGVPTYFLLFP